MSLSSAVLNKLLDWMFSGLPGFVVQLIFPGRKIKAGVYVSQSVQRGLANIYISERGPHSLKNLVVEFHNHLPFPVTVEVIEGKISRHPDVLVEDFSKLVRIKIKHHRPATFDWSCDLPSGRGLEKRKDGETYCFDIAGRMVLSALNEELEKDVTLRVWSFIHKGG